MPGKTPYSDPPRPSRGAPVFPADMDSMLHVSRYLRQPASVDGACEPAQWRKPERYTRPPYDAAFQGGPARSLLAAELLRIERVLENDAADAGRRNDLPRSWKTF